MQTENNNNNNNTSLDLFFPLKWVQMSLHSFFTCSEVQLDNLICIRERLEVTSPLARLCRAQVAHLNLIFSTDASEHYSWEALEHDVQMSLQRRLQETQPKPSISLYNRANVCSIRKPKLTVVKYNFGSFKQTSRIQQGRSDVWATYAATVGATCCAEAAENVESLHVLFW